MSCLLPQQQQFKELFVAELEYIIHRVNFTPKGVFLTSEPNFTPKGVILGSE